MKTVLFVTIMLAVLCSMGQCLDGNTNHITSTTQTIKRNPITSNITDQERKVLTSHAGALHSLGFVILVHDEDEIPNGWEKCNTIQRENLKHQIFKIKEVQRQKKPHKQSKKPQVKVAQPTNLKKQSEPEVQEQILIIKHYTFEDQFKAILEIIKQELKFFVNLEKALQGGLTNAGRVIIQTTTKAGQFVIDETVIVGKTIGNGAVVAGRAVGNGASAAVDAVGSSAKVVGNTVVKGATTVANGTVQVGKIVGNAVVDGAKTVGNGVSSGANVVANGAKTVASSTVSVGKAIGNTATSGAQTVGSFVSKIFHF